MVGNSWKAALMQPPRELVRFPLRKGLASGPGWAGFPKRNQHLMTSHHARRPRAALNVVQVCLGWSGRVQKPSGVWKNFFIGALGTSFGTQGIFLKCVGIPSSSPLLGRGACPWFPGEPPKGVLRQLTPWRRRLFPGQSLGSPVALGSRACLPAHLPVGKRVPAGCVLPNRRCARKSCAETCQEGCSIVFAVRDWFCLGGELRWANIQASLAFAVTSFPLLVSSVDFNGEMYLFKLEAIRSKNNRERSHRQRCRQQLSIGCVKYM